MTGSARRTPRATGQLDDVELRGRDASGRLLIHLERLHGLVVGIGRPAWATGPTAAALHGFDGFVLAPPFHLVLERGRNIARVGHAIHTTLDLPLIDRCAVAGIPSVTPTRALLSIAPDASLPILTAALDGALRDGLTSEDFLHRRLGELRRSGRPGITPLLAAIGGSEVARGGHSWLEREFLRLMANAGLPRPATQQVLGRRRDHIIRVDCRFDGTPVVVELLGYRFHRSRRQMAIDVERTNRLQLLGLQVLQFTYPHVVDDPREVVATVRAALRPWRRAPAA